jgi:hypothetical protein
VTLVVPRKPDVSVPSYGLGMVLLEVSLLEIGFLVVGALCVIGWIALFIVLLRY